MGQRKVLIAGRKRGELRLFKYCIYVNVGLAKEYYQKGDDSSCFHSGGQPGNAKGG
jgi:hypothetical protein